VKATYFTNSLVSVNQSNLALPFTPMPSLKKTPELFVTKIKVIEMRWQHFPNLWSQDTDNAE